jgi:hypothetical protein
VAQNGDFRQGGSLPLDDLSVTSKRDSTLATQRSSTQRFMNGPSPAGTRSRPPGADDSKRDQPWLRPREKIKNGRAHAVCRPRA